MKKITALFIATLLFISSSISAFAVETSSTENKVTNKIETVNDEIKYYAYLDVEEAKADIKAKILIARNNIIYSKSWTTSEFEGAAIGDARTGKIISTLPQFNDLFPGWTIPTDDEIKEAQKRVGKMKSTDISKYAYLDIDTEMASIEEKILNSRKEIIYNNNWVADGYTAYIGDMQTGKEEALPNFSDLFPGWDLPIEDTVEVSYNNTDSEIMPFASTYIFNNLVYLYNPGVVISRPFFTTTIGRNVQELRSFATSLSGTSCNIGFTNMNTNQSITYASNLSAWQYVRILGSRNSLVPIGVRASTNSTQGNARMVVERFLFN